MNFFRRLTSKKNFDFDFEYEYEYEDEKKTPINGSVEEIMTIFKETFKDANDLIYRDFYIGNKYKTRAFLCRIDGLTGSQGIDDFVMEPLLIDSREADISVNRIKETIYDTIKKSTIAASDMKEVDYIEEAMLAVLSGDTALFLEGYDKCIIISSKSWPTRSPAEPIGESVVRGPRDGLVESLRANTALIRRRIKDPRLKVKQSQVGRRSKSDIALMYIDDIVDKNVLAKIEKRLSQIDIDAIIDSSYIQQFLEIYPNTPFPQIQSTERPDSVAAAIYEGKIAVVVDNSPNVLILPVTVTAFFQSAEDYYTRPIVATTTRILRIVAVIIAMLAPSLYVALTSYNPEVIPATLALSITASRETVPFPSFIEMIIMEITLDLLREAGIRLPKPIGATIGVVGGLVIGQAAVSAGIVSPIAVIIIAITALATYATPHYEIEAAFRLFRIAFICFAGVLGLYGVVIGVILVIIHLCRIESYGVPYFEGLAPLSISDLKDSLFVRVPWNRMRKRPEYINGDDSIRQGGKLSDKE